MLISEVIFLDLSQQPRLVKCSHSSKTESTCRTAISTSLHVASCPQERHLLTGKKTSFQSGCEWGCRLRIIIPLHTKRNTPSGKLLHARNIWVPSLECSIAKKWLLWRLDRLPTELNKEYHSLQTTSLCKKWPCKRGLCIFSKLTGLALGFASLHTLVSSAAECQVSHLSIPVAWSWKEGAVDDHLVIGS